ncbi:hypothetical protein [Streptomyces nanshensis]|uniref:hypothetical protein n=1 Tax=Streptomyces nanshensis TaxID=518642 RepID=UPI001C0E0924|nr:hypothetical protein [Streptomyces nanshensis]
MLLAGPAMSFSRVQLPLYAPVGKPRDGEELRSRLQRRQLEAVRIQLAVERERTAAERERSALFAELITRTDRIRRNGEGPQELLPWLQAKTGAAVVTFMKAEGETPTASTVPRRVVQKVAKGPLQTGTSDENDHYSLLHAVGVTPPHEVLVASRRCRDGTWKPLHREFLMLAAAQIRHLNEQASSHGQLDEETRAVGRALALQQIMRGDIPAARRTLPDLLPDLLKTEWAQIGVLRCAKGEDRRPIRDVVDRALDGRALVVLCPAEPTDVLVLHPRSAPGALADSNNTVEIARTLAPIVSARPERLLGISHPTPWIRAVLGYVMAAQLLERAAVNKNRIAADADDSNLPMAMGLPDWARNWATGVLAKLNGLPEGVRHELVQTATLTIMLGPKQASRLLGTDEPESGGHPHRVTVSHQLTRLEKLLELGNERVDRAVLLLALQLSGLEDTRDHRKRTLREVLHSEKAQAHARRLLDGLTPEQLELLTDFFTLGRAEAARRRGWSTKWITRKRDDIAAAIGRSLSKTSPPWGTYDVLLALVSHPDTTMSADLLPDPAPSCVALLPGVVPSWEAPESDWEAFSPRTASGEDPGASLAS